VTIKNKDSADDAKMLNGAHIKIVNKDSGEIYRDIIKDNGTLVCPLPLGSYTLTQELAPNDYQLNSKAYEFTLQVPQNVDVSNIKVVNASVDMFNDLITADTGPADEPEDNAVEEPDPWASQLGTVSSDDDYAAAPSQPIAEFMSAADKNPVTADNSNMLLAILIFSFIIMTGGIISRKYLTDKL